MDAQDNRATTASRRDHEGYGTVSMGVSMVNGVGEGVHLGEERRESSGMVVAENPNLHDPAPRVLEQAPQQNPRDQVHGVVREGEPPYAQGGLGLGLVNAQTPPTTSSVPLALRERFLAPHVSSAGLSQEYFSAESRPYVNSPQQPQAPRWMTRMTEFLRTTASRGVVGMDRMLDSLGFQHVHMSSSFENPTGTQEMLSVAVRATSISPPEELPPRATPPRAPPVPSSWSVTGQQEAPLFAQEQIERMRQAQREHPLLLGQPSEEGSEHSSRLQAEVQRQMEEYASRCQEEVQRLQQEVQLLRREKNAWSREANATHGTPEPPRNAPQLQGNLPQQANLPPQPPGNVPVPPGNAQQLPGNLPQQADLPPRPPGVLLSPAALPPQDPGVLKGQHGVYQRDPSPPRPPRVSNGMAPVAVPKDQSYHPPPEKDQANIQRTASELPGNAQQLRGNLPQQADLPPQPPGPHSHSSGGVQGRPDTGGHSSGGVQGRPDTGGHSSGGVQGRPDTGGHSSGGVQGQDGLLGLPNSTSAERWLGSSGTDGKIALLADGITQLQAAMIKQMDKKAEGDRSPEAVKPGTPALPLLKEVCSDTSCVDVMDWLEVIDGPMSDLSDSSAAWWKRVMTEANKAYSTWSLASPLDRLSVVPEISDMEDGKFSRLNSRAAAMVVAALHDSVREEVVARRLTGSTVRLIFRILTLYQPGGEGEKLKILQNLQSPNPECEAGKAVTSLRTWSRWLRRCRDLGVQAPDPSLLARGLTRMLQAVMERNQDASFRTSLVKSTLQIDTNPSYDKVESYFKHLMAECEALAVSSTSTTTTAPTTTVVEKPEPRIKPMRAETKAGPPTTPAPSTKSSPPTPSLPVPSGNPGQIHEGQEGYPLQVLREDV